MKYRRPSAEGANAPFGAAGYDAVYAAAILTALDRASHPSAAMVHSGLAAEAVNVCGEAFHSQILDPAVRVEFNKTYYPNLSASQRTLADTLMQ